jgi:hypothetical protein
MVVLIYCTKTLHLVLEGHNMNLYSCQNYIFYASYQAFKSVELRSLFFWDVTLCHWVRGSQRFHVTQWSHHQESKCPTRLYLLSLTRGPLKVRPQHHPETSVINYAVMQQRIPEEWTLQILFYILLTVHHVMILGK